MLAMITTTTLIITTNIVTTTTTATIITTTTATTTTTPIHDFVYSFSQRSTLPFAKIRNVILLLTQIKRL